MKTLHTYEQFLCESALGIYDIIILDIMLSEDIKRGWMQILEHIRKQNSKVPIIIMSNISDCEFLEQAFFLWAHDYIIKPFRIRELEIRVQRWFHNYVFQEYYSYEKYLEYHELVYYPAKNQFFYKWYMLNLSRSNKHMLSLFMIHRNRILTHEFLVEKIWWYSDDIEEKNLRIKVLRLKKQLKNISIDTWVQTIRWEWYILQAH